jgi:hypothetical protein
MTLALLLLCPVQSHAQNNRSQTSQSFKTFWMKFKAAVVSNDREAVAAMTKLPFYYDDRDLNREEFIKNYDKIIERKDRRCLARAKPVRDVDIYEIFCGQVIFYFSRVDEWKFMGLHPND